MQAGPGNFAAAWTDEDVDHLALMYWSDPRPSTADAGMAWLDVHAKPAASGV